VVLTVPFADPEARRAYGRGRMARLYADGKTWWQQRPRARQLYDAVERGSFSTYYWVRRMRYWTVAVVRDVEHIAELAGKSTEEVFEQFGKPSDRHDDFWEQMMREHADHIAQRKYGRRMMREARREIELVGNVSTWKRLDMALLKEEIRGRE
jgi:hypothetical protein